MEITVQITVKSQAGEPECIQQVAHLERGTLRPDTLGLSLAPGALDPGGAGANAGRTASGGVCDPSATLSPLRTPAHVQRSPRDRSPYSLW